MTPAARSLTPEEGFVDELKPGTRLLQGQYTIRKYLNAGGFGITYLAADSLDRNIVIKECFPGAFCRRSNLMVQVRSRAFQNELGTIVQLFLKEARSLSKLNHPNIVGVHQVFEGNNTAYMALDFIEGEDLFNLIEKRDPRLTPSTIRAMLEKLLDAIGAVHGAGLLHRDISPDNVILTAALEPMLIDFGAAREQATRTTRALSALRIVKDGYSPQEFYITGSQQGPSSDLYSLAATFYHVITNELPPDSQQRIAAQVEGRPDPYVPLAKKTGAFDQSFCEALDRAMAILPKLRFQSAQDWLAAISAPAGVAALQPQVDRLRAPVSTPLLPRLPATGFAASPDFPPAKPAAGRFGVLKLFAGGSAAAALLVGGVALTGLGGAANAPADTAERAALSSEAPTAQDTDGKAEAAEAFRTALAGIAEAPADAQAEAQAPAASAAAPVPAIAAAPVVMAREDVPGVGVLTSGWTVELPFTATEDMRIASASGPAAEGLVPGLRIAMVDGQPVATLADVVSRIQAAKPETVDQAFDVRLTLEGAPGTEAVTQVVSIAVIPYSAFSNGLAFQSRFLNGAWITTVAGAPPDQSGGIRAGDVLVATMPSREPIAHVDGLRSLILREAQSGKAAISIVVRREGLMWVEDMALGATAG
jgi:serine/threonine protein kinase